MPDVASLQDDILELCARYFPDRPLSEDVIAAFRAMPRHGFVTRYKTFGADDWRDVTAETLNHHLPMIYKDGTLCLHEESDGPIRTTISQPSFVLHWLELLELAPGHKVFELGAGSGWNAALMAHLVGAAGHVVTAEIVPEMAALARQALARNGVANVTVVGGDGGYGHAEGGPYDRAIFTAGAFDLPRAFHAQVREGGRMIAVIKVPGGGDVLYVMTKMADHFATVTAMNCGFVQMTGDFHLADLDPIELAAIPGWAGLKDREVGRTPFWWGGRGPGIGWRTAPFRSYLAIRAPGFLSLQKKNPEHPDRSETFFGLLSEDGGSLVVARGDELISYGSSDAREALVRHVHDWVDLGMPSASSLDLRIYPSDDDTSFGSDVWVTERPESRFVWTVPGPAAGQSRRGLT